MRKFLHVGCGHNRQDKAGPGFRSSQEWQELRFDIDETVLPDVVGSMTNMSLLADNSVDALYSAHNIEHLYPHEVPLALQEFRRVIKTEGFVVITCPDLQSVCQMVANDKLTDVAYHSPAGPITPLDMLYGHREVMARGNLFMSHRCGFTQKVLEASLLNAGFASVAVARRSTNFDLWALASKNPIAQNELLALAKQHFPAANWAVI